MATLTDEQYQQFLDIYDEAHDGLATYDTREHAYPVRPGSQWDGDFDGVYRTDDGIWAQGDAVSESMQAHMDHTIFDGEPELVDACWERLNQDNR